VFNTTVTNLLLCIEDHTCAWGFFLEGGPVAYTVCTRFKLSAKSRGLYTYNIKVLAWGDQSPTSPPRPRMLEIPFNVYFMKKLFSKNHKKSATVLKYSMGTVRHANLIFTATSLQVDSFGQS